jgi:hypothetical protein
MVDPRKDSADSFNSPRLWLRHAYELRFIEVMIATEKREDEMSFALRTGRAHDHAFHLRRFRRPVKAAIWAMVFWPGVCDREKLEAGPTRRRKAVPMKSRSLSL